MSLREKLLELRGLADAAYGCGAWLDGASYAASARKLEEQVDEVYNYSSSEDHQHHVTFSEPTDFEKELRDLVDQEIEEEERKHRQGWHRPRRDRRREP